MVRTVQVFDCLSLLIWSNQNYACLMPAYVACSGLPETDPNHAQNVANFAVAVNHCCSQVLSPIDNQTPIRLRIGIHSGSCASGIVGTTNPRYCVFGDTVNQTSRHESTGVAGRIHCSSSTKARLDSHQDGLFELNKRGFVEMKGVGQVVTYWLNGSEFNPETNGSALTLLDTQVQQVLAKTSFNSKTVCCKVSAVSHQVRRERKTRLTLIRSMIFTPSSTVNLQELSRSRSFSVGGTSTKRTRELESPASVVLKPLPRIGSTLGRIGSTIELLRAATTGSRNDTNGMPTSSNGNGLHTSTKKRKRASFKVSNIATGVGANARQQLDSSMMPMLSNAWDNLLEGDTSN